MNETCQRSKNEQKASLVEPLPTFPRGARCLSAMNTYGGSLILLPPVLSGAVFSTALRDKHCIIAILPNKKTETPAARKLNRTFQSSHYLLSEASLYSVLLEVPL